ncbi:glycoside hydrolase family 127 protein [Alteromonas gilva]|uniref:Glycoside hydrolase family 127 protein n=1 Tax=Alteromonas gilva TaxID=2987522 RepID=A0ABT5KY30_9ALTE|nr:glycoside hydrolase family 127 protein [Alteromonas gilva]MDC8829684.1 glycoside hydrolase family 127 protein [Alteromonas gilva]
MKTTTIKHWCLATCVSAILLGINGCSQPTEVNQQANPADKVAVTDSSVVQRVADARLFDLQQVRITDGPFAHAMHTNVNYLLAMEPDKLLAPYLREAGIAAKSESYGNWENTGLDGHIGGHYLSALSLAYAATGDTSLVERLDYMLDELKAAQEAGDGYLGGIPNSAAMWAEIKAGNINADLFSLNERWVPLYNIDKIFHGLRDAYEIAHREQAKTMLMDLGAWMLDITANLSDEQIQQMLYSEHGGLNEVFADMANISGDARYLALGRKFTHNTILDPLTKQQDKLTGLHANTQIPKIIGALRVAELDDDQVWIDAAKFFWQTVTQRRSVSIGGNSVREHFHDEQDFTPMVEDIEGPETCNTYNMMKLSKMLFLHTGEQRYLDFYERATYNHILSSQHPEHGGLVYFTSMRPGHYRMYSSVHDSMWCCVGSGIENHSKYGELVFTHTDNAVWVNLFMSATVNWQSKGVVIEQQTRFPDQDEVSLVIGTNDTPATFTLNIRQPEWASKALEVKVNGQPAQAVVADGYVQINRQWQHNDKVTFNLHPELTVEQLPDGQDYYSVLYGPVVMATPVTAFQDEALNFVADDSRMGHIAAGPVCPPEALPIMLGEPQVFLNNLQREDANQLAFIAQNNVAIAEPVKPQSAARLVPFFRLHDSRYQVYWPQLDKSGFDQFVTDASARADNEAALAAMTVDKITPGEQQPEVEHDFKGQDTQAGVNNGRHWRDASGYFQYRLSNPEKRATALRLTYFSGDVDRRFDVLINGEVLASVTLPEGQPEADFYTVDYPLSQAMTTAEELTLKFAAKPGSVAGGIYGIRLIAE